MTRTNLPTPDWHHWRKLPTLTLFEATALSMNIAPKSVRVLDPVAQWLRTRTPEQEEFIRRLSLARRCIGETLRAAKRREHEEHVYPAQFVAWALSIGWKVSAELSALAANHEEMTSMRSSKANREEAVKALISELGRPGQEIPWKSFHAELLKRCGVTANTRGYNAKTIKRIIDKM